MLALLVAYALFIALNIGTAVARLLGLGMTALQLFHRSKNGWLWLIALPLFFGGSGALLTSWGLCYVAAQCFPNTCWPTIIWVGGYLAGGVLGVVLSALEVVRWKWDAICGVPRLLRNFCRAVRVEYEMLNSESPF